MLLSKILFHLTAGATTVFIITILAMVSMLVGNPDAPINGWFNVHGATVMTVEVVAIGVLGMSAMIVDRQETLREQQQQRKSRPADQPVDPEMKNPSNP